MECKQQIRVWSLQKTMHISPLFVNCEVPVVNNLESYDSMLLLVKAVYEDIGVRSSFLEQVLIIASHSVLWDAITYPYLW